MSTFSIQRYTPDLKELWNDFIASAKNATFLFNRYFMDYHSDRFKDYSLLIFKEETLFGVLPANLKDNMLYSHQGLSYGGLVLNATARLPEVVDAFAAILIYLETHTITKLELKVLPTFYQLLPAEELSYILFLLEATWVRVETAAVIDYRHTLPLHRSRSGGLKKAAKAGLYIQEEKAFDTFWNTILIPNLYEKHQAKPVHTLSEIDQLAQQFPEHIRQFNVYDPVLGLVAGATVFVTRTVAHVQYISSNDTRQELGSLDFLFNHLINTVFTDKQYFDLGTSNENQGQQLNTGLQIWKESFGARTVACSTFSVDTATHKKLKNVCL